MALELPFILGSSNPEQAAITLYGFLQQNILFDAFSNKLAGMSDSVDYLNELCTLFSMIGMLVLIFSPSLWKAKYIASWGFLFIAVYIGGSTGPEFSYNLARSEDVRYANINVSNRGLACTNDERVNGACYSLPVGKNIAAKVLLDAGVPEDTIASLVAKGISRDRFKQYLEITAVDNQVSNLQVRGFLPQVYVIYATNRLRHSLEIAFYDLNARNFSNRMDVVKGMLSSKVPNPQLGSWITLFDSLCGGTTNVSTATLISSGTGGVQKANLTQFSKRNFKLKEVSSAINVVDIMRDKNPNIVSPSIDLVNTSGANMVDIEANKKLIANKMFGDTSNTVPGYIGMLTVNKPDQAELDAYYNDIENGPTLPPVASFFDADLEITDDSNISAITERIKPYSRLNQKEIKIARKKLEETFGENLEVGLVLPKYTASDYQVAAEKTDSKKNGIQYLQDSNASYTTVRNCSEFLTSINKYYTSMISKNIDSFGDRVTHYKENCSRDRVIRGQRFTPSENAKKRCIKSSIKNGAGSLETMMVELEHIDNQKKENIEKGNSNEPKIYEKENALKSSYIAAGINNYLAEQARSESSYYKSQGNSLQKNNMVGASFAVGEMFTDAFTKPLSGLKAIGEGFRAGAYSKILPIIKNIIIAFILIMTPILFLLGLLVPAWAPGVIATSIVTLLFLQMTDVVMVVVQAVLVTVEESVVSAVGDSNGDISGEYQNFLEIIWAMAYMSSFAVTAFVMFAAGNSKAILSKMAGLDKTVQSTADSIAKEGWGITKQGIGLLAPGLGNTAISSTAAFNTLTGAAAGVGNFVTGNSTNSLQEWSHAVQSKTISGSNENNKIKSDISKTTDVVKLHEDVSALMAEGMTKEEALKNVTTSKTSKMMNEHKKEKAIKTFSKDLESSMTDDDSYGLHKSERIKSTDSHGKLLRKGQLLSGKNFGNTNFRDKDGVTQEASGVDDQTAGLEKFSAENGWKAKHIGATQAQIYKNIDNSFNSIPANTKYQVFENNKWVEKTVKHGNMKLHWMNKRDDAIKNISESGADLKTSENMLNQVVKFRIPDGEGGFKYGASKISDDDGAKMKTSKPAPIPRAKKPRRTIK